jgi:HPt (histidine-containing phosphotransfer) domain-containing protein
MTAKPASIDIHAALVAADNDPDLLQTLIGVYFEQLPSLLTSIEEGLESRYAEVVERNAHSLKGAISIFGNHPARESAQALERSGRVAAWSEAFAVWDALRADLEDLSVQLHELAARLSTGTIAG